MKEIIKKTLGIGYEERTAFLGGKYAVFPITHRKAVNALLRAGWKQAPNPSYIVNGEYYVNKKPSNYKNYFIVES